MAPGTQKLIQIRSEHPEVDSNSLRAPESRFKLAPGTPKSIQTRARHSEVDSDLIQAESDLIRVDSDLIQVDTKYKGRRASLNRLQGARS